MTRVKIHKNRIINGIEYTSLSLSNKDPLLTSSIPINWTRPFNLKESEDAKKPWFWINIIYKKSDFNILHFGEAKFKDRVYCIISTPEGFYVEPQSDDKDEEIYPLDWRGLLVFKEGAAIFDYLNYLYGGRAWYAVPKEYCEMKRNVCYKKSNLNMSQFKNSNGRFIFTEIIW